MTGSSDSFAHRIGLPAALMAVLLAATFLLPPATAQISTSDREFQSTVRPLLKRYCHECHAGDLTEADIDLGAFVSMADVRQRIKTWLKVREMIESGQMPPQEAQQLSAVERDRLRKWVRGLLAREAESLAGDPGPIVLRRLNNAEYTYTIRDLTGLRSLDPTREFPVDGAAGEGFTNVGSGQGMSPALVQKYLDAAKSVADHTVLVPDGLRFSPHTTRRDQTDELLARIQKFYRRFTADGGGSAVDLQGIKFETNQGGLLPLEPYLAATLQERAALEQGQKSIRDVARERSLNERYLATLWDTLSAESDGTSPFLAALRKRWRSASAADVQPLTAEIAAAQKKLWKFNPVGHIGRVGGPSCWQEAVSPITTRQDLRLKLPEASASNETIVYLVAGDVGDGNRDDVVVWRRPRIEFNADESGSTQPPVLLRDLRAIAARIDQVVTMELDRTAEYLAAVVELQTSGKQVEAVATAHALNRRLLQAWKDLIDLGPRDPQPITGRFRERLTRVQGYEAINGWGSQQTPSLLTNRADQDVSFLTLTIPARGVVVHPSPTSESIVAWRSPMDGKLLIKGRVADADDKCGNGVAWRVVRQSAGVSWTLADGLIDSGGSQPFETQQPLEIHEGDVVSLVINARDHNHGCDTTHIELEVSEVAGQQRVWNLANDVVDDVLQGNPMPDSYGHGATWHFGASGDLPQPGAAIPADSTLGRWRQAVIDAKSANQIERLGNAVQLTLVSSASELTRDVDQQLRAELRDWKGPLHWMEVSRDLDLAAETAARSSFGLDPALFGKHPDGLQVELDSLCVRAPRVLAVRLPSELVGGAELVTTGVLHPESGSEGSVQLQLRLERQQPEGALPGAPILVQQNRQAAPRLEQAIQQYRDLFPPALCYARIVPVDEVVTLTLFYREDDHLRRLMLTEQEAGELDQLWDELYFVSQEPLKLVVAFEQISEFATQDRPDLVKAFAPMRSAINQRAEAFRRRLIESEPAQLAAAMELAGQAWRHPLTEAEQKSLRTLYDQLRARELPHDEAIRLLLARVLTSSSFLYKLETPGSGTEATAVSDHELATRLSYFLWSSLPDDELRTAADQGRLRNDRTMLLKQTRRMLKDPRTRRLAIQFACQWLHVRNFDKNDDKNEQRFPEFAELRGDMYEETVWFFEDMFRNDGSILDMIDADHAFLNQRLARHYGIVWDEHFEADGDWRRIENVRAQGRGGVLAMATVLASQSGASRTSPILRGNWIYETLLGERLPRPPAGVPQLPEAVPRGLTARQLIEQHSSVAACAKCHHKIDPYGFALEQYDAIGRVRPQSVDTRTKLEGGQVIEGLAGLRDYLMSQRREDLVQQFCRKLLGYALGRETQLSDEPLLSQMQQQLTRGDYRFHVAVEAIVSCDQFRKVRGAKNTP